MKPNIRFATLVAVLAVVLAGCQMFPVHVSNPDPNHTHADFAVWARGQELDFSAAEFMSSLPVEDGAEGATGDHLDPYLHLHDGNGHIIHRHKPGLTLGDFFHSLSMEMTKDCFAASADERVCNGGEGTWRMFVNGEEVPFSPNYVFEDLDRILLTFGSDEEGIQQQLQKLTDEACRYSRTCPDRGEPPTENCIADPAVPCVLPPEDL